MRQWKSLSSDNQVPWWVVVSLRNRFYLRNFVESGTAGGETAVTASELFQHVYTVELCPTMFNEQFDRLRKLPNVTRACGSSPDLIRSWLPLLTEPSLFYLDGHWTGSGEKLGKECPLLDELEVILPHMGDNDIVMIDNGGLFIKTPPPPHDPAEWPTIDEIRKALGPTDMLTVFFDVLMISRQQLVQLP